MPRELIMYSRTFGCPFISVARRVLKDYGVEYREIFIDKDPEASARVREWTGFLSVPTLVAAEPGSVLPYAEPAPLEKGRSPRGVDRGSMITEPNVEELKRWLQHEGFLSEVAVD